MNVTRLTVAVPLFAALVAARVEAEPIFASPPHVVADGKSHRIVLFLNEPVSGALAARAPDGSYVVRVPRSAVAPAIQGQDFGADGWGDGGDAIRHLVLAAGEKGDTHIRIQPAVPVGGVDAHTADDPPRLEIELLASAPTRTPAPVATRSPARSVAPKATASKAVKPTVNATSKSAATPRPHPTASPKPTTPPSQGGPAAADDDPVATAAAPRPATATVLTALAPMTTTAHAAEAPAGPTAAGPTKASTLPSAPTVGALLGSSDAPAAPSRAPAAPAPAPAAPALAPVAPLPVALAPTAVGGAGNLGCLWQRVNGLAFCAPDPKAPAYAGDKTITTVLASLARGRIPEPEPNAPPPVVTPATLFLAADREFIARAPQGKFLPAIDAYRRALRDHPEFPEAWRARLNMALAYRALEFLAELKTEARNAAVDPTAGLVRGLAGDAAMALGQTRAAEEEYRAAAAANGAGPCLAARGRARLAIAANDGPRAAQELAGLPTLCPAALAADPETIWVRARAALASADTASARTMLTQIQGALGRQEQGAVIADLGAVAEAEGDEAAARKQYDQLLGGDYGARAARQATVRLAILDGVGGDVHAGLKRLDSLTPEASDLARRALVMQAARTALARGEAGAAIATLHEARIDAAHLGLEEQLLMAAAYLEVGLASETERVLAAARVTAGTHPPDALFTARGAAALARRDAVGAAAIAEEWIRIRGRSGGALALRARAIALGGDGPSTHAAVAAAVMEDPSLARPLALDAAEALRERDPAAALVLAREALEPGPQPELPAGRAAAGLAMIGQLAEAAGDSDTALAAFTTLSARHPTEPIAADAAYRAARLAARHAPGDAPAAWEAAAKSKDALSRRVAGAARDYEAIVRPLGGPAERR